jgi:phage tail-like protein
MPETNYYPPGAFYFSVQLIGAVGVASLLTDIDNSFEEVSGITAEFQTEEIAEGGENRFKHRLPTQASYSNLVLKRGVVTIDSVLAEWCGETIGANLALPIVTQNILVMLLNEQGIPSIAWGFSNAWPIKWDISAMNAQENKVLTETLEFSYNYFERINLTAIGGAAKIAKLISKLKYHAS